MRFFVFVAIAFVAAFGGISGFMGGGFVPMRSQPAVAERTPAKPASLPDRRSDAARNHETTKSYYDSDLNRLRTTAQQASYAYSVAPCNPKIKADLVAAVTAYAKAFIARTGCGLL